MPGALLILARGLPRFAPHRLASPRSITPAPAIATAASTTKLVKVPRCQLQNGRAKVPDFLRLSNSSGQSYAPTSDPSQARPAAGSWPSEGRAAFAGVGDGSLVGAVDDCPVLADNRP